MFLRGRVTYSQSRGPRETQEDYVVHIPFVNRRGERGHLLGVMDGHGGEEVAKYCAETIPTFFERDADDVEQELRKITQQLNARTQFAGPGSTLSLAYVSETSNTVTTAVLGDSPIIVVDDTGTAHWSDQHNVRTNLYERSAAIARGAIYSHTDDGEYICVTEGGEGLQVGRTLGDRTLASILSRTPSVRHYRISSQSMVMVASDGLFSSTYGDASTEMTKDLVAVAKKGDATDILHWREQLELEDNTSVVLWKPGRWWHLFS